MFIDRVWAPRARLLAVQYKVGPIAFRFLRGVGGDGVGLGRCDAVESVCRRDAANICPLEYTVDGYRGP